MSRKTKAELLIIIKEREQAIKEWRASCHASELKVADLQKEINELKRTAGNLKSRCYVSEQNFAKLNEYLETVNQANKDAAEKYAKELALERAVSTNQRHIITTTISQILDRVGTNGSGSF